MKKTKIILGILGIIAIIISFVLNFYFVRLFLMLLGITLITIALSLKTKHIILEVILSVVFFISLTYGIDYLLVKMFNKLPVYSIMLASSDKVIAYNSVFYRVYACGDKYTLDNKYALGYVCNNDDIPTVSINKFLENPNESYKNNLHKFVHLEGKITTIIGVSQIALNAYENGNNNLNGYVEFNENKIVYIDNLNIDPKDYYIYDIIEVIGEVATYQNNDGKEEIHLSNAILIESDIYKDHELVVNNIYNDKLVKDEDKIYYLGIEGIYYKYDENNIYALSYLLKDKRETIDNLIKGKEMTKIGDDKVYNLIDYQILELKKDNTIFVRSDYELNEDTIKKIKEDMKNIK